MAYESRSTYTSIREISGAKIRISFDKFVLSLLYLLLLGSKQL